MMTLRLPRAGSRLIRLLDGVRLWMWFVRRVGMILMFPASLLVGSVGCVRLKFRTWEGLIFGFGLLPFMLRCQAVNSEFGIDSVAFGGGSFFRGVQLRLSTHGRWIEFTYVCGLMRRAWVDGWHWGLGFSTRDGSAPNNCGPNSKIGRITTLVLTNVWRLSWDVLRGSAIWSELWSRFMWTMRRSGAV